MPLGSFKWGQVAVQCGIHIELGKGEPDLCVRRVVHVPGQVERGVCYPDACLIQINRMCQILC